MHIEEELIHVDVIRDYDDIDRHKKLRDHFASHDYTIYRFNGKYWYLTRISIDVPCEFQKIYIYGKPIVLTDASHYDNVFWPNGS